MGFGERTTRTNDQRFRSQTSSGVDRGSSGCRSCIVQACNELGISKRTYNRWKNSDSNYIDKRTICARSEPVNKLTPEEKQEILDICNSEEFASKTPVEIVPILADRGIYIASESTFYKVL